MKYGFQAKIGRMDGVIVAYHNTSEIFGFQYIPLADMERCIYGLGLLDHGSTGLPRFLCNLLNVFQSKHLLDFISFCMVHLHLRRARGSRCGFRPECNLPGHRNGDFRTKTAAV